LKLTYPGQLLLLSHRRPVLRQADVDAAHAPIVAPGAHWRQPRRVLRAAVPRRAIEATLGEAHPWR
jgi:hypothetical protein